MASLAGILDAHGGLRVVVGTLESIFANCSILYPEKLFILPGVEVYEPVPWDQIPWTIRRVELYIEDWIRTRNDPDSLSHIAIQRYQKYLELPPSERNGIHIAGLLASP